MGRVIDWTWRAARLKDMLFRRSSELGLRDSSSDLVVRFGNVFDVLAVEVVVINGTRKGALSWRLPKSPIRLLLGIVLGVVFGARGSLPSAVVVLFFALVSGLSLMPTAASEGRVRLSSVGAADVASE